jgi:hypothetical protein
MVTAGTGEAIPGPAACGCAAGAWRDAQADSSSALSAAQSRLSNCQRRYEDIRTGPHPVATDQARREWGEALKGWIWAVLA